MTDFDDPNYERYSQRLAQVRGIRKYMYRMDILERHLKYGEVTEIFVRVNSLGAKLRSSDLALAQITSKWRNSLKTFQEFDPKCTNMGFDLDLGLYLKNLIVFATGQSRFLTVNNLSLEALQSAWKTSCAGMEFALNFMKSNLGIDSPALLSSPFILITLAFFGHRREYQISPKEAGLLRYWVLLANAKGRYSRGSSETILDQDLAILREGGVTELIDRLRLQVGRLDVAPDELEGRNQRSALFKTMFLAFRASGAKDWRSNLSIALDLAGAHHKLQFQHIFPKAVLTKHGHTSREADDIANLAFIGGKTNRTISDKPPSHYLPPLIEKAGSATFEAQCIPTEEKLLEVDSYELFLEKRQAEIVKRLNEFLSAPT